MPTDMMNRILMPDATVLEVHDVGRGQANGVATLDANGDLVQQLADLQYGTQIPAPEPYTSDYTLTQWLYLTLTGGLN